MSLFDQLLDFDPVPASPEARVETLVELQKAERWFHAQQLRVLAAVALDPDGVGVSDPARAADPTGAVDRKHYEYDALALALRLPHEVMPQRMFYAITLVQRLPATVVALSEGRISVQQCYRLVDRAAHLDDARLRKVEQRVLPRAVDQTTSQFSQSVRRAVLAVEGPAEQEERLAQAVADRRVCRRPGENGMTELWMLLPATEATAVWSRIQTRADFLKTLRDGRTADQRRADAIVDLILGRTGEAAGEETEDAGDATTTSGSTGSTGTPRVEVQVTVALSTLLGLDQQPGELTGYGPIPAALARQIAADSSGTWRRLVTDQCGVLLDYGRSTYRPPAALADHVIAKHHVCRVVGCNRPAVDCELDHRTAWAEGGTTCDPNLWPLCARHHHLKHEAGWQCELREDGTAVWTTPTGHTYQDPLQPLPIDTTITGPPGDPPSDGEPPVAPEPPRDADPPAAA